MLTPVRSAGHACCECVSDASVRIAHLERQLEDALVAFYTFHAEHHGGAFITCERFPCTNGGA